MEFQTVFGPNIKGPSEYYRIPSLITAKNGVLVACADARYCSGMDNPNRIDKVIRRSFDCGRTWEDMTVAVKEHGTKQLRSSAAIDPVMVYSEKNCRIILIYSHTPAGTGIRNSRCSRGEDENGNKYINSIFGKKYILKNGKLFNRNGKDTPYTVDESGNVSNGKKELGNIYTAGKFKEERTSYLMMVYSEDNGKTWSEPRSLNRMVKKDYMSFIGPGPGCGIVIKHGKYAGRIAVPIYFGTRTFPLRLSCAVIYSDDGGESWKLGETPNNTREINGKRLNCMTIKAEEMLTESQLIEQENGTLKYFIRNHAKTHSTAVAYSKNGGESWQDFRLDESLPQPVCQMSVIKLENTEKPTVVFINPADRRRRQNGTVRLSEDDGETFKWSRLLKEGDFVYSSAVQMKNGEIGVLFEPNTECREIKFASFTTDWIKGGGKNKSDGSSL